MFFLIWGWRGREVEVGKGRFQCPQCDGERSYRLVSVATYFTLYFVPLFATERHGEYVACKGGCGGKFVKEILSLKIPTRTERVVAGIRADLDAGMPTEMARTKLENEGLGFDAADELVAAAAGPDTNHCSVCKMTYAPTIAHCLVCGGKLGSAAKPARLARLIEDD